MAILGGLQMSWNVAIFMKIGVHENRASLITLWRGGLVWGVDMHEFYGNGVYARIWPIYGYFRGCFMGFEVVCNLGHFRGYILYLLILFLFNKNR